MMQRKTLSNWAGLQILMAVVAAGVLGTFSKPAQAADQFDTNGIQFDVDTIVEFEFVQSQGAYQSTFGVVNLDTGEKTPLLVEVKPSDNPQNVNTPTDYTRSPSKPDFTGTPGNTVTQPLAEFEFKAKARYAFYLESTYNGRPAGIVYSSNALNSSNNQQARFDGNFSGLGNGGTINLWDDTGSVLVKPNQEDTDFNDFTVRAGGHLVCPYANNVKTKKQSQTSLYGSIKGVKCTGK